MQRPKNQKLGKRIGQKVQELRRAKEWTQAELAKKLGCHQPDISQMESGQHVPQTETLVKLSLVFQVSLAEFVSS